MNLSKQSIFHIETFIKNLKKKELQIDEITVEVKNFFDEMVAIKDFLGTTYNNEKININERSKIFIDKLKELEVLGEKHDNCVKRIKELKDKIDKEIEILISNIVQIDNLPNEQIRNYIFQYIESKR